MKLKNTANEANIGAIINAGIIININKNSTGKTIFIVLRFLFDIFIRENFGKFKKKLKEGKLFYFLYINIKTVNLSQTHCRKT